MSLQGSFGVEHENEPHRGRRRERRRAKEKRGKKEGRERGDGQALAYGRAAPAPPLGCQLTPLCAMPPRPSAGGPGAGLAGALQRRESLENELILQSMSSLSRLQMMSVLPRLGGRSAAFGNNLGPLRYVLQRFGELIL